MRTGDTLHADEQQLWPDGSTTWVSTTKLPLRDTEARVFDTYGISEHVVHGIARWFATHLVPEIGPDADVVARLGTSS